MFKTSHPKHAPKPKKADPSSASQDQLLPVLSQQFPWSSSSVSLPVAAPQPQSGNAQKSHKAIFHQRANRIGKVEARISKIEESLVQVQVQWPKYVHQVRQLLAQEHQKCLEFHQSSMKELQALKEELHGLLTQHPVSAAQQSPGGDVGGTGVTAVPSQTPGSMHQVYTAIELLASYGIYPTIAGAPNHGNMEVDPKITHAPAATVAPLPTVGPPVVPVEMVPQVPPGPPSISVPPQLPVHQRSAPIDNAEVPPGQWGWPPISPEIAVGQFQLPSQEPDQFPNPLYKPPTLPDGFQGPTTPNGLSTQDMVGGIATPVEPLVQEVSMKGSNSALEPFGRSNPQVQSLLDTKQQCQQQMQEIFAGTQHTDRKSVV